MCTRYSRAYLRHLFATGEFLSVVLNSIHTPAELGLGELADRLGDGHLRTVPATDLARRHVGRPLPNVCLLGALAALTGRVTRGSLADAVRERFSEKGAQGNVAAL